MAKKSSAAEVIPIPAQATYDIWAYGVVLYEAIARVPLSPYACRGKRAMTMSEVGKIGTWDEQSVKKSLKAIPDDAVARDLLRQLLHHDPAHRVTSMRQVLDHPFFTGGNLPSNRDAMEQASPNSMSSTPSKSSRSTSTRSRDSNFSGQPGQVRGQARSHGMGMDPPELKTANSMGSIENRENNSAKASRLRQSESSSPGDDSSVRSGRSFGGGFRKLRSSLRRQNA
jgi:serine/threonine protein kinase